MKKWKKLVALALAAILAMSLLTACGGGGGSQSFETQVENAVFSAYSQNVGNRPNLKTNDPSLRKLANNALSCITNGRYYETDANISKSTEFEVKDGKVKIAFAMPIPDENAAYGNNWYTVLAITPEMLNDLKKGAAIGDSEIDKELAEMEAQGATLTGIGVAAKTIDGKTYVAVAMRVEGNASDIDTSDFDY